MTAKDFFEKTTKMREAQKLYKSTRLNLYFAEARELEGAIDNEIERVRVITERANNPRLF